MTPFQQRQLTLMRQMEQSLASGSNASTIVPMRTDYASDSQLALTCISFLPKEVITTIQTTIIEPLKSLEPSYYYYLPQSLHLTVQNIRVINDPPHFGPQDVTIAQQVLSAMTHQYGPFSFTLRGVLSMPTSISIIALVSPQYDQFVRLLRRNLQDAGVPDDKSYFTDEIIFANITICRYTHKPSPDFLDQVTKLSDVPVSDVTISDVSLVEINAGAHPSKTRVFGTYRFVQNRG